MAKIFEDTEAWEKFRKERHIHGSSIITARPCPVCLDEERKLNIEKRLEALENAKPDQFRPVAQQATIGRFTAYLNVSPDGGWRWYVEEFRSTSGQLAGFYEVAHGAADSESTAKMLALQVIKDLT